ncbi:hypothetical protein AMS68_004806 [Peltaster fructicola]|uniref:Phosphoribosylaminoimidazole-succinocarboxamide synthase n=1 Tax=Peltaster fructicola TaxID=286661 RepID=A0A6H0XXE3_9PEZI|nr:hypothetical protein AMS68_004806 [Peltaster fructicola]
MSSTLSPNNEHPLQLRETNVSKPSILHRSQSEQSITASESYYSLSSGDSRIIPANDRSQHTIQRFQTPPSRYRTPLQSGDNLGAATNEPQTALKGQGQRRHSLDNETPRPSGSPTYQRDGALKRKPVPSTVIEGPESMISSAGARSSVAMDMARGHNAPTPDVDDTPFIHFALDQLTRDEEVRGSRAYLGPTSEYNQAKRFSSASAAPAPQIRTARAAPAPSVPVSRAVAPTPTIQTARAMPAPGFQAAAEVPPRNPNRPASVSYASAGPAAKEADVFLPLAASPVRPLHFVPGILRTSRLVMFLVLLVVYLALLLLAAIYSLKYNGLWNYGTIGDNRYFVFQYLPILLGMILLLWLFQIQVAVARIAPFLAMSSATPAARTAGVNLPIYINDLLLPKLRYFQARLPVIGFFMLAAWLQLFTIPLLSSAFNVYFVGSGADGNWRWNTVQGVAWATIILYIILIVAVVVLMVYLARINETGLRWDPRSLADVMVMLERSNALDANSLPGHETARLGFWRTSNRPNDAFHAYGHANAEPRRYGVEAGKIREKHAVRDSADTDLEANRWRHSKDRMLGNEDEDHASSAVSYPWFLRITSTLLWAIIAFVLLLAFLIVSYLPSTSVFKGFAPNLPVIVGDLGFGADNFLFSFIPAILAMLCLLFWLNIDYAFRRFAPVMSMLREDGELAERNLLLSYPADFPVHVSAAAAANGHWRVALVSLNTLVAATIPILAGGVFWAQFDVPTQAVRIYAHTTGFYALTVFVTVYALSYFLILPLTRVERNLALHYPRQGNHVQTFSDIMALVRNSKILDDFAFHGPVSKVDLVTRLLSVQPGAKVESRPRVSAIPEAGNSMLSLADSLRGFGNARQRAIGGTGVSGVPRYGLARWAGRDGIEHFGIDRFR